MFSHKKIFEEIEKLSYRLDSLEARLEKAIGKLELLDDLIKKNAELEGKFSDLLNINTQLAKAHLALATEFDQVRKVIEVCGGGLPDPKELPN